MVAAGAAGVEGVGFEHDAHRGARVGELAIADATDRGDTVIGLRQVEEHLHRRRLPGPVRTEEAGDPAGRDLEGEVIDDRASAVALGHVGDGEAVSFGSGAHVDH